MIGYCPVCNSTNLKKFATDLYDDRYGYPGFYSYLICSECGHIFLATHLGKDETLKLYSEYYPRSQMNPEDYKPYSEIKGFKAWLDGAKRSAFRWIPRDVKVLDIGCGFCETLGYHKERGCEVWGVEADSNVKKIAQKYGFNVFIGLFNSNNFKKKYFDFITMDQVLEHAENPVKLLKDARDILKDNGSIIVSIPSISSLTSAIFKKKWLHWHVPYHTQFFSLDSLQKIAINSGLKIDRIKSITDSEWLFLQIAHWIFYPDQGTPSEFWKIIKKTHVKLILAMIYFLKIFRITHILTRIIDLFGKGDNLLVIMKKNGGKK